MDFFKKDEEEQRNAYLWIQLAVLQAWLNGDVWGCLGEIVWESPIKNTSKRTLKVRVGGPECHWMTFSLLPFFVHKHRRTDARTHARTHAQLYGQTQRIRRPELFEDTLLI